MKFMLTVIAGCTLCILAQIYFFVWWIFAPLIFLFAIAMRYRSAGYSFLTGLVTVFASWMIIYLIKDAANGAMLSTKMAAVFSLPDNYLLFIIASLLMAVIGGLSSMAGYALRPGKASKV